MSIRDGDVEVVPDTAELTSFDRILELKGGGTVHAEAKITESEFGTAKKTCVRERRRTGRHASRLPGIVPAPMREEPAFYAHDQLLRNRSDLSAPTGRLVRLIPRAYLGMR